MKIVNWKGGHFILNYFNRNFKYMYLKSSNFGTLVQVFLNVQFQV